MGIAGRLAGCPVRRIESCLRSFSSDDLVTNDLVNHALHCINIISKVVGHVSSTFVESKANASNVCGR